jgi:cyclophilin family peptidyl-prolyl cis-trans isomerase
MKLRMNGILTAAIIFAASTMVLAQGGGSTQKTVPVAKPPATAAAGPFDKALLTPSALTAKSPEAFDVKFTTNAGEFVVHVTREWAPLGADRFYNMVKHHFLDGAAFFRVIPNFMAQFGLSPYPELNSAWSKATIKDDKVTQSNKRGAITFATAGPNTRTTQLFINFKNNSGLDSQGFAPFGEVTSGMDVVDKINSAHGEQPDQGAITTGGKAYLEKNFPDLTIIKSAVVVPPIAAPKP